MSDAPSEPPRDAPASERPSAAPTVLVVDDERNIRRTLELVLSGEGYRVLTAGSGELALDLIGRDPVDLAIVDLMLPGMSGLDLLSRIRSDSETAELPVVVISGHATVHDAVSAIKLGASDFFEKPLVRERVLVSVSNALRSSRLARQVEDLNKQIEARYEMIGHSPVMQRLYSDIDRVAPTKASVLITGESGTGKELISRAIHQLSPRRKSPFIRVNCAAIPRELIESELFGHEKGSFTGAQTRKRGFFEQAHTGTLFLDEIGDMELSAQSKVLRALQSGEVSRVGSEQTMIVDVRVLAATNKDLSRAVADGQFREDLFFRLNVFPIRSPALRERRDDIAALAAYFLETFCKENNLRPKRLDETVVPALERRTFPGNVRELKNAIERAAILAGDSVTVADLPEDPHANPFDEEPAAERAEREAKSTEPNAQLDGIVDTLSSGAGDTQRPTLREFRERAERAYIVTVLAQLDWNISRAAVSLGVERTNLHKKIRAYGIRRGEQPGDAS